MKLKELRKANVKALRKHLDELKASQCMYYIGSGKVFSEESWEGTDCIKQGEWQMLKLLITKLEPLVVAFETDMRATEERASARACKKYCEDNYISREYR